MFMEETYGRIVIKKSKLSEFDDNIGIDNQFDVE